MKEEGLTVYGCNILNKFWVLRVGSYQCMLTDIKKSVTNQDSVSSFGNLISGNLVKKLLITAG